MLLMVGPLVAVNAMHHLARSHHFRFITAFILMPLVILYLLLFAVACYGIFPYLAVRRMRPELLAKVGAIYGENLVDAPMVGFSAGSGIRLHKMDTSSDFGLLVLKPGKLIYLGDTMTFQLTSQQLESVSGNEQSLMGQKIPRVLIGWRETPDTQLQGFTLEAWDASTLWQSRAAAADLLRRIEEWRRCPAE